MNYIQAVDYIYSLADYEKTPVPHAAANYDLRRLEELLGRFDNPHLKTKAVHITGTKGKGSTAAMVASALTAAGYAAGLYTSPHLLNIRERIRIGTDLITENDFASITEKLEPEIETVNKEATYGKLTTFEVLTAMAFIYFARENADWQVLEVGLGGNFDATNVIKNPYVCVITSISYDHTEVLGNTLAAIAGEKCGIIKPGCTVITSPQKDEAMQVIENVCRDRHARLFKVGSEILWRGIDFDINSQQVLIEGRKESYELSIPLLGDHQMINAATAVAALEVISETSGQIKRENIIDGLRNVNWPGRFQIIGRNPLIVIDGAHNQDSAAKLSHAVEHYLRFKKAVLVIGSSSDKDISGIAEAMAPIADKVIATRSRNPRAMQPERIVTEFERLKIPSEIIGDVPTAIDKAINLAGKGGLVCVTGSLFVVAEALENAGRFQNC
jgi:dihydrofolate synthase / folylpolyglutamate synthase